MRVGCIRREKSKINWTTLAVAVVMLAIWLVFAGAAEAEPPYEPNDSLLTAYGPLANNAIYTAALETENDKDLYYFYVTSPSTAQVTFTLTNLGGGSSVEPELRGYITDSHGSYLSTVTGGLEPADYATNSVSLKAGKYYVVVETASRYGESYTLATSGTEGAFGAYSTIVANCAAATVPVTTYQAQLAKAEAKLRKAGARLHQLRYSRNHRARRKAQAKYQHVKAVVVAEKASLKAAEKGQKPWCFIPA